MEHLPNLLEMLRVVKSDDLVSALFGWAACQLPKWLKRLKTISWTLNVTRHEGNLTVDFHAGNRLAPLPVSSAKSLPAPEPKPTSRKRNRALPSDTDTDNS